MSFSTKSISEIETLPKGVSVWQAYNSPFLTPIIQSRAVYQWQAAAGNLIMKAHLTITTSVNLIFTGAESNKERNTNSAPHPIGI